MTLTVTDDEGASTNVVKAVAVTGPPPPLALDHFDRTVSDGWGDARFGGPWLRSGSATNFAVQDGVGTIRMSSPGAGPKIVLPGVTSTDTDLRVRVGLDKTPTGGGAYITLRPRVLDSGDGYYVDTRFLADQTLTVTLGRTVGGADDALETIVVPGIDVSEGDKLDDGSKRSATQTPFSARRSGAPGTTNQTTGLSRSPTPPSHCRTPAGSVSART